MSDDAVGPGDESLAEHFTPQMNAVTSRFGVVSDIPVAFAAMAVLVLMLILTHRVVPALGLSVLGPVAAIPLVACVIAHFALRGARAHVVAWLSTLPFAVDNMNAVLAGSGEFFEIHFQAALPPRTEVMARFETVSADVFVLDVDEAEGKMSARFGVDDSKYNPIGAAHRRYRLVRAILGGPLAQLHADRPIKLVRFL